MPLGLQVVGRRWHDHALLDVVDWLAEHGLAPRAPIADRPWQRSRLTDSARRQYERRSGPEIATLASSRPASWRRRHGAPQRDSPRPTGEPEVHNLLGFIAYSEGALEDAERAFELARARRRRRRRRGNLERSVPRSPRARRSRLHRDGQELARGHFGPRVDALLLGRPARRPARRRAEPRLDELPRRPRRSSGASCCATPRGCGTAAATCSRTARCSAARRVRSRSGCCRTRGARPRREAAHVRLVLHPRPARRARPTSGHALVAQGLLTQPTRTRSTRARSCRSSRRCTPATTTRRSCAPRRLPARRARRRPVRRPALRAGGARVQPRVRRRLQELVRHALLPRAHRRTGSPPAATWSCRTTAGSRASGCPRSSVCCREHFRLVAHTDDTYAFELLQPLTAEQVRAGYPEQPADLGRDGFDELFARLLDASGRAATCAARWCSGSSTPRAIAYLGDNEEAAAHIRALLARPEYAVFRERFSVRALESPTYTADGPLSSILVSAPPMSPVAARRVDGTRVKSSSCSSRQPLLVVVGRVAEAVGAAARRARARSTSPGRARAAGSRSGRRGRRTGAPRPRSAAPRAASRPGGCRRSRARRPARAPRARSMIRMLGILGTKTSPPCIGSIELSTNSTACSSVIQKRVMRSSVIVSLPVCGLLP